MSFAYEFSLNFFKVALSKSICERQMVGWPVTKRKHDNSWVAHFCPLTQCSLSILAVLV